MGHTGNKSQHAGKAIVAGGISGAIEIMCTYPLEYTKTVAQLSKGSGGALAVAKDTMRRRGPLGFYRGLSSMVYFATPKAALRFSAFEAATAALRTADGAPLLGSATGFVAGLVAGTCEAVFVSTPQETIKIKLIDDQFKRETPKYRGFFHGVYSIVREAGFSGIYRGVGPTVLKVATAQATRFGVFNVIPPQYVGILQTMLLPVNRCCRSDVSSSSLLFVLVVVSGTYDVQRGIHGHRRHLACTHRIHSCTRGG
jgi:solute carrier family 25 citrate transporter 1